MCCLYPVSEPASISVAFPHPYLHHDFSPTLSYLSTISRATLDASYLPASDSLVLSSLALYACHIESASPPLSCVPFRAHSRVLHPPSFCIEPMQPSHKAVGHYGHHADCWVEVHTTEYALPEGLGWMELEVPL